MVSDGSDGGGGGGGMAVIDGKNHKARFGLAVACIGNLNLDGRSQSLPKGIEVNLHLCDLLIKLAVHLNMCPLVPYILRLECCIPLSIRQQCKLIY